MGTSKTLIVGSFILGSQLVSAILDTGATASFIAQLGGAAQLLRATPSDQIISIQTADNCSLTSTEVINSTIRPSSLPETNIVIQLLVIPGRYELMGQDIIIGLDALKAMNVTFHTHKDSMIASIDNCEIGRDVKLLQPALLATVHETPTPEFDKLIEEYLDIFAESAKTFIDVEPMAIPISVDFSTKAKLRPHSVEDIIEIKRQVHKMIENDIVERSESTFSANVHLVPKKNGTKRLVVDFRFLNAITIKDHYPLPQMSEMFLALHGAKHFAALDCTEGFLQIPILPEHKHRTAFVTSFGSYHYKRVPFGFTNSPAKFQRTMNDIFEEGLFKRCIIYIDDILIFAQTKEELLEHVKWVFDKCRARNLKLKLSKCAFNRPEVEFLGFKITHNQICPVTGKYDTVGVDTPTKRKHILGILGSLNHYSRFIANYADKVAPLRKMTRQGVPVIWTPELAQLIKDLKAELAEAMPITIPDSRSDKRVDIFVSATSIEITCYDDNYKLIGRAGLTLSNAETGYTIVELQLRAIQLAYDKFHMFMRGKVIFRSTCQALSHALKMTERTERVTRIMLRLPPDATFEIETVPGPSPLEQILLSDEEVDEIFYTDGACVGNGTKHCRASWAVVAVKDKQLTSSGIVDHHRKSSQVAELTAALKACEIAINQKFKNITIASDSRYLVNATNRWIEVWKANNWKDNKKKTVVNEELLKQLAEYMSLITIKTFHVKGHSTDIYNIQADQLAKAALTSTVHCGAIITQPPRIYQGDDQEIEMIKTNLELDPSLSEKYTIVDNQLYYLDHELPIDCRRRLFVPCTSRNLLLKIAHDDPLYGGHLGIKKTRAKLIGYYWPRMSSDVERFIKSCTICQSHKTPRKPRYGYLHPLPICEIFERIHIDIIGPMHKTPRDNQYIITAIDAFSRYAYARAVTEVKTIDIINFMTDEIFTKHGCPSYIVSDNGPQFVSHEFKRYVDSLGIKHNKTVEYHPQANGLDERLNGTLVKILKNYMQSDQNDWDLQLQWAVMLYNTTNHATTTTSPYVTLYGVAPKTPLRALQNDSLDKSVDSPEPAFNRIRDFVKQAIMRAQEQQTKYYNRNRQPQDFKILDSVWAVNYSFHKDRSRKLQPKWEGPYFIFKIIDIEGEPKSVVLVHEQTGKYRRCSFQDMKHSEQRDNHSESLTDELVEQALPGVVFQQATISACQEPSSQSKIPPNLTSSTCTTEVSGQGLNPWKTLTTDADVTTLHQTTEQSRFDDSNPVSSRDLSSWDELLPRSRCENHKRQKVQTTGSGQTASGEVVTYSRFNTNDGQTARNKVDTNPTIDPNRHHTVHEIDDTIQNTQSHGQTVAINQNNQTISITSPSSQTASNLANAQSIVDEILIPTNVITPSEQPQKNAQAILQSTPLAQASQIPMETEHELSNIASVGRDNARIEEVAPSAQPDSQESQNRPKRQPRAPDRYQSRK